MSIRRLRVLIDHLPPESATKTALRNEITPEQLEAASANYQPDKAQWSMVEILLAGIKDEITLARNVSIAAAGGKPPDFNPTPRPGISTSARKKTLTDEQRRELDPRLRSEQPKE